MNLFTFFTPKKETYYLEEESTIRQALEKFDIHKFSVVPLLNKDGVFVSTVSEGDILRFIKNDVQFNIDDAEKILLKDVGKYRPYSAIKSDAPIEKVIQLALDQNFVPIVDDNGVFMGIIKRKSIIEQLLNKIDKSELD